MKTIPLPSDQVSLMRTSRLQPLPFPFGQIFLRPNGQDCFRLKVAIPKRVARLAVSRNRSKRLVREAVRLFARNAAKSGVDMTVVLRMDISKQKITDVYSIVERGLKEACSK